MIDLTGQKFGKLTVLKRDTKRKTAAAYWICQCECGAIKSIRGSNLRQKNNPTRSCGCLTKERKNIDIDSLVGKRFGRLIVQARNLDVPYGKGIESQWYCLCDCGKTVSVRHSSLIKGHTKSCGCYRKEVTANKSILNLQNKKYGSVTVLENTQQKDSRGCYIWECRCDCRKIFYTSSEKLQSGHVNSCGCSTIESRGEQVIKNILKNNNIDYIQQYSNNSCRNPLTNSLLYFDFCIFQKGTDNILFFIEFDGIQHFKNIKYFKNSLKQIQYRDIYKNQWCKNNNYKLYRIPYYDLKELQTYKDLIQNKYLVD